MSLSNFKLTGKEIIIALSLVSGFFFQWYTLKMEIREQFLEAGFQKQTNEKHFELVDNNVKELSNKVNSLERKSQQILFMMYKEADKPKRIQLENEQ
jgi:hypothetical protein